MFLAPHNTLTYNKLYIIKLVIRSCVTVYKKNHQFKNILICFTILHVVPDFFTL